MKPTQLTAVNSLSVAPGATRRPAGTPSFLTLLALATGVPLVVAGAAAAAAANACPGASDAAGVQPLQRQAAVKAFLSQRYADAYGRFAQLADGGDTSAALIALMMVCQGPTLFGSDWSATPGQLRRWSALAIRDTDTRSAQIAEHDRGE